jgi:hypothetical protein
MPLGSGYYRRLSSRLEDLRRHLLSFLGNPPVSKLSYSPEEFDATRAYLVLAHAEIEDFCESLVREKVRRAEADFRGGGRVSPALRKMLSYYVAAKQRSWSDVISPSKQVVNSAVARHRKFIQDNHGIKRKNIERMLYPIGLSESRIDPTWLAQMDSFGSNRGAVAHTSGRASNPPDPLTTMTTVNQLLAGLLQLERTLRHLR